jgi:hypothetical protein
MSLERWQEAARYTDAEAEEGGIEHVAANLGIEIETLTHVAEQRALRVILMEKGRLNYPPHAVRLTRDETARLALLTAMYMDGLTIGWRAHRLVEGEA